MMDIISASEEIKDEYRSSFKYAFICETIDELFDKRKTINKTYPSNTLKDMMKKYYWKVDKEINMMMNNNNDDLHYISNELVALAFYDLGFDYKQNKTYNYYYYFNVSFKKNTKRIIYS